MRFQDHVLAVAELAVRLPRLNSGALELVGFEAEPGCWRRFHGAGRRAPHAQTRRLRHRRRASTNR